jgi:hypothetical protein
MTIYNIELRASNLSRLPSTKQIVKICIHICYCIIKHFSEVTMIHDPVMQKEISSCNIMIQWYLGILERATTEPSGKCPDSGIYYIYLEKSKLPIAQQVKKLFSLECLGDVSPRLLIEFMHKLLSDSLTSIKPRILTLTKHQVDEYVTKILVITTDLSYMLGITPVHDDLEKINFDSVMMRFYFVDQKNEIKDYV